MSSAESSQLWTCRQVDLTMWWGEWSFWDAVKKARPDKLEELLLMEPHPETKVNGNDEKGLTPLMVLMRGRNSTRVLECWRILLSFGADVAVVDDHKDTALHHAAANNKAAVIRELLGAGADLFARNQKGFTALDVAWSYSRREAAGCLMQRMQLYCGWLEVSEKVEMPQWRRCWCTVLGGEDSTALCVFRHREQVRPDEILHVRVGTQCMVPPWSLFEFHIHKVKVESIRGYLKTSSRSSEAAEYCREFAFACDGWSESNDRYAWMRALQVCSEFAPESRHPSRTDYAHIASRRQLCSLVLTPVAAPRPPSSSEDLDCIVCMETPRDAICAPCGHTAVCRSCLVAIRQQRDQKQRSSCPVCRTPIKEIIPMAPSV